MLPAAAACGWGFKIHLSVSLWSETQLGGCGGGGSPKRDGEEHPLACPTARGPREGKERRPRCRRQPPAPRALGTQLLTCGLEGAWAEGGLCTQPGFSTPSSRGKQVRPPPPGPAFILKNVRKEMYRFPPSSLFGCVCCDWKSFSPTWLRLSLPSLCCSAHTALCANKQRPPARDSTAGAGAAGSWSTGILEPGSCPLGPFPPARLPTRGREGHGGLQCLRAQPRDLQ